MCGLNDSLGGVVAQGVIGGPSGCLVVSISAVLLKAERIMQRSSFGAKLM